MNVKSLASKIKELNNNNGWTILLVSYFISIFISSAEEIEMITQTLTDKIVDVMLDYGISVAISILCCTLFYDKYLYISTQYTKTDVLLGGTVASYMKYHGFSVEEYFSYIMRKFLPIQIVMTVTTIVCAIAEQNLAEVVVGVIVFIIPFLIWQLRKVMFNFSITHREIMGLSMLKGVLDAILGFIALILVIITFLIGIFGIYGLIDSILVPLNDNAAVICITEGKYVVLMVAAVFWPVILFSNVKMLKKGISTVIMVLILAINLYGNAANHTIIEGNSITVVENFKENTYSFDKVDKFEVLEDETEYAIAMKLHFDDGKMTSVTMANYSNTEKWDKRYDNEYEFIKEVATQLLDEGAEGRITKPDKLVADIKEYWDSDDYEDEEKALKEIVELLSE